MIATLIRRTTSGGQQVSLFRMDPPVMDAFGHHHTYAHVSGIDLGVIAGIDAREVMAWGCTQAGEPEGLELVRLEGTTDANEALARLGYEVAE